MRFVGVRAPQPLYVDRYRETALVHDVQGRHNNCVVRIVAVPPGRGMTAGDTVGTILQQMGLSNFSAKVHGRRNPYSVVRATFAALSTHQSIEQIALKRGRRLLEVERQFDREKKMPPRYQHPCCCRPSAAPGGVRRFSASRPSTNSCPLRKPARGGRAARYLALGRPGPGGRRSRVALRGR